ncbi:MAG TPA: hypothetical protein VK787_06785, partial [Puia sp.]|nr:hypothetical protein [Puia sp.]
MASCSYINFYLPQQDRNLIRVSVQSVANYFLLRVFFIVLMVVFFKSALAQNDSSKFLKKVIISAEKKQNTFNSTVPLQLLNQETLEQINAESVADAAKY